jgi:hypothetical protein
VNADNKEVVFDNLIEANVKTDDYGKAIKAKIPAKSLGTTNATGQIKTRTTSEITMRASRLAKASLAATS